MWLKNWKTRNTCVVYGDLKDTSLINEVDICIRKCLVLWRCWFYKKKYSLRNLWRISNISRGLIYIGWDPVFDLVYKTH